MKQNNLLKKIAKLETVNDQLVAELQYLEKLTRALGFVQGLKTLKEAALEMLSTDSTFPQNAKPKKGKVPPEVDDSLSE